MVRPGPDADRCLFGLRGEPAEACFPGVIRGKSRYLVATRPAALFGPCLRHRVGRRFISRSPAPRVRSRALRQYQRRSARTRVRGCLAGRAWRATAASTCPRPGRGSSPAAIAGLAGKPYAELATSVMEPFVGDALPRGDLLAMARDSYARFGHPGGHPAGPDRQRPVGARAVPRADAGLQGRRHAAAGAPDGPRARPARRARDHRRRHLRRYRRRGHRGVPRLQAHRRHHPVPARARLRRAAAHDDDGRRGQRARRGDRRHLRRLPGAGEGACSTTWPSATASGWPASTRSTGRAWWRRSATTSRPPRRWAHRTGRSPSRCRPATSATSWPATRRAAWDCRSSG